MKKRTREEMALYQQSRRKKIAASIVTPASNVTPKQTTPIGTDVTPSAPPPVSAPAVVCRSCKELEAALVQAREESAALRTRVKTLLAKIEAHDAKPITKDEADALRDRVIAAKVERINTYGKGHAIGTIRQ